MYAHGQHSNLGLQMLLNAHDMSNFLASFATVSFREGPRASYNSVRALSQYKMTDTILSNATWIGIPFHGFLFVSCPLNVTGADFIFLVPRTHSASSAPEGNSCVRNLASNLPRLCGTECSDETTQYRGIAFLCLRNICPISLFTPGKRPTYAT